MASLVLFCFLGPTVVAVPTVSLPFNSQVPKVAIVAEPYVFELSENTFTSAPPSPLSYTLLDAPAWLNFNGATRTLYGSPGQGDNGTNTFTIDVSDSMGTASMDCTLVVTTEGGPRIAGNLSAVLAEAGALATPNTLSLSPGNAFTVSFGDSFFHSSSGTVTDYYATLSDHTPLPSWLTFDSGSLGLFGLAPNVGSGSTSWTIDLIASDVAGFSGAVATFTIAVSSHQLAFEPQQERIEVTEGNKMQLGTLLGQLKLDGRPIMPSQVHSSSAVLPAWLTMDNKTLDLAGTPPAGFTARSIKINVVDMYGDTAVKSLVLYSQNVSLFESEIGNLTAIGGERFSYTIGKSVISQQDLEVNVELGSAMSWLHFNTSSLELNGTPPTPTTGSTSVVATLTASTKDSATSESQLFTITVRAAPGSGIIATSSSTTRHPSTHTSTSTATPLGFPTVDTDTTTDSHNVTAGVIVGVIVGCLALIAVLIAVFMLLCRRRKSDRPQSPKKINIGRPQPITPSQDDHWQALPSTEQGVERSTAVTEPKVEDPPPRISLPARPSSLRIPQALRRSSLSSSIGAGDIAIQRNSDIPVWGDGSKNLHRPHDSYSAAMELGRLNAPDPQANVATRFRRLSSPKKRASGLLRSWHSQYGPGLRVDTAGNAAKRRNRQSRHSSRFSASRDRSSCASFNTERSSLLSATATDFPEPPKHVTRHSHLIPAFSATDPAKRRSIRLVSQSGSVVDDRPLSEKRQSFIRNRASSSLASPLFASSRRSSNLHKEVLINGSLRRYKSTATTFSASSSLEPPPRNPRRIASRGTSILFPHSESPTRPPSGTLPVIQPACASPSPSTASPTNLSLLSSPTAAAAADFAAQLSLPRHQRTWVLPGEASPTPPPSSAIAPRTIDAREAARRKWAQRLQRDAQGGLLSSRSRGRSPRGVSTSQDSSPVRLTGVARSVRDIRGEDFGLHRCGADVASKSAVAAEKAQGDAKAEHDRVSMLVSKDSLSAVARNKRARIGAGARRHWTGSVSVAPRSNSARVEVEAEDDAEAEAEAGAEDSDGEWEDVVSIGTRGGECDSDSGAGAAVREETPMSVGGEKAFI